VTPSGIHETRDPAAKPVDQAVVEEAAPSAAGLANLNDRLAAQVPGFVPLRRPFTLCIRNIWVRSIWGIDRRYVFDTSRHHWEWTLRNHITLRRGAYRVWLTKTAVANFHSKHHHPVFGQPPTWTEYDITRVRSFRVCYRVVVNSPNQVVFKIDQLPVTVPVYPANPNSQLMLLSTHGDENGLFRKMPAAVLAGKEDDTRFPFDANCVFIEPIDPMADTLDIGLGGTGVFGNRPLEARGMDPLTLAGNQDSKNLLSNNQLQLYCWVLEPDGTFGKEVFATSPAGFTGGVSAASGPVGVTLAITPTPAIPSFEDEMGNPMDNATMFTTTLMSTENEINVGLMPGRNLQFNWEGLGKLVQADEVTGPFTDVPGATASPVTVPAVQMKRFSRVQR